MNKEIKLFRILANLSKDEVKLLQKAVESPLYSLGLPSQKLYSILMRQYPNFDSSSAGKEKVFIKLFPTASYDDLKLNRVFSNLTQVVKKFLAYNELQNNDWQREKTLSVVYENMRLSVLSEETRQGLHQTIDQTAHKNEDYWKKKMILYGAEQSYLLKSGKEASLEIAKKTNYAADCYFAYTTVRHTLLIKSKALIFNTPYNLPYLEAVKQAYRDGLLREDSFFRLYVLALELTENPREDVFFAYQSLFFSQEDIDYRKDGLLLFKIGLNYAVRQRNVGDLEFQDIPLIWYKLGLNREILFVDNLIERIDFSNIVYLACMSNEIDWALKFVEDYTKRLPREVQEEELLYSKALISFQDKRFYKVINNIFEYPFSLTYTLKYKNLILKSHFEIYLKDANHADTLNSNIVAFENYLYRDKSRTKVLKLPHVNFCKILKKILLLKMKNTKKAKIKSWLEQKLKIESHVAAKNWLIEKVNY